MNKLSEKYVIKSCITCGMPLEGNHAKDFGMDSSEGPVCRFDSENGKIKSGEEQPLGPFIAASAALYILFQPELTMLADLYMSL